MNLVGLAEVWRIAASNVVRSQDGDGFTSAQKVVLEVLMRDARSLYQGDPGPLPLCAQDVRDIARRVVAGDKSTYREKLLFLAKGIVYGNELHGWAIPVNTILIRINREKNHITPGRFGTRHRWRNFLDAYRHDLESSPPSTVIARMGQLLLAAIFFGGLIESKWLDPWLDAVSRRNIYQEGSWMWVDMVREHGISADSTQLQQRRWIADPLSQLLIYQYLSQDNDDALGMGSWSLLKSYFSQWNAAEGVLPQSRSELLDWAFDRYTGVLPGVLIGYARGEILSTSLPIEPWLRTISGNIVPVNKPEQITASVPLVTKRRKSIVTGKQIVIARQIPLFRDFIGQINPKRLDKGLKARHVRKIVKEFMATHSQDMSVALQLLLGWAHQLSERQYVPLDGRKNKEPLAASSVYRYLTAIGIPFLDACELHDPRTLDPIDLELLYEEVSLRKNSKRYNTSCLKYFHEYLSFYHGLPGLDFAELLDRSDNDPINVDANIISPAIYAALLRSLNWKQSPHRWQTLHLLATILSYRAGLRPSEIQSLLLRDLQFTEQPELLVRNSVFHRTKSAAGRRRIPLTLLDDDERDFLYEFYRQRTEENTRWNNDLLLHHPVRKTGMLSDEELIGPIRTKLKDLTKDQSLRFYALRHTFMTQMLMKLMLRDDINPDGFSYTDHADFHRAQRENIKLELFRNERCGRKFLYGVAMLAGHSSPKTSCKHYIHLFDWLLGYHLRHISNDLSIHYKAILRIADLSPSTYFYQRTAGTDNHHSLLPTIHGQSKKFASKLRHPLLPLVKQGSADDTKNRSRHPSVLPPWDQALERYLSAEDPISAGYRAARRLPDQKNWQLAEQIYSAVGKMSKSRLKAIMSVICYAIEEKYPGRWGGIDYTLSSQIKQMLKFLNLCNISQQQMLIIHHPRRDQTCAQRLKQQEYWKKEFSLGRILSGEDAALCGVPARGIVTLIITTGSIKPERLTSARRPKMSSGFIFALDLLHREYELCP